VHHVGFTVLIYYDARSTKHWVYQCGSQPAKTEISRCSHERRCEHSVTDSYHNQDWLHGHLTVHHVVYTLTCVLIPITGQKFVLESKYRHKLHRQHPDADPPSTIKCGHLGRNVLQGSSRVFRPLLSPLGAFETLWSNSLLTQRYGDVTAGEHFTTSP
jgi:hypothetical protein